MDENVLAVYSPGIGVVSETFIRRHMVDLYPVASITACDAMVGAPHKRAQSNFTWDRVKARLRQVLNLD